MDRENILALSSVAGLISAIMIWVDLFFQWYFNYQEAVFFTLGFMVLFIGFMYINKKWEVKE